MAWRLPPWRSEPADAGEAPWRRRPARELPGPEEVAYNMVEVAVGAAVQASVRAALQERGDYSPARRPLVAAQAERSMSRSRSRPRPTEAPKAKSRAKEMPLAIKDQEMVVEAPIEAPPGDFGPEDEPVTRLARWSRRTKSPSPSAGGTATGGRPSAKEAFQQALADRKKERELIEVKKEEPFVAGPAGLPLREAHIKPMAKARPAKKEEPCAKKEEPSESIPREGGRRWADGSLKKCTKAKRGEERDGSCPVGQRKHKKQKSKKEKSKKEKREARWEAW